jgi:ankyrin repeat protein
VASVNPGQVAEPYLFFAVLLMDIKTLSILSYFRLSAVNGVQPSETFEFTSTSSFAVDYGYEAVVKLLLARVELDVNSKDPAGQTLLSCAASMGNSEMVKLLLTRDDLDVSSRTSKRQTPLLLAADKGHDAVVELLRN